FPFARNKASSPTQDKTPSLPQVENPIFSPEISVDENGNGIMTAPDGTKTIVFVKAPYIPKIIMTEEQKKINAENLRRMDKKNHGLLISPESTTVDTVKGEELNKKHSNYPFPANHVFPSKFDLREHNWVTPAKDQGPTCGACVSFATIGAVESNVLKKYGISMDLSENHLKNVIGTGSDHCSGAIMPAPTNYMAGWVGPVLNQEDPYNNGMSPISPQGLRPRFHIQNIYPINRGSVGQNSNGLKVAIMNYGGGATSTNMTVGCFNNNTLSPYYYCSQPGLSSHAMTIVGWDDNISRYNFIDSYGNMPAGDGAFIVKDSYGPTAHDNGFVYLSYYDLTLGISDKVFFYDTDYIPGYLPAYFGGLFRENNKYHYSSSSGPTSVYVDYKFNYKWGSATYTAQRNEKITAIGFGTAMVMWMTGVNHYEVYVYTNSNYNTPLSGTLVTQASGTFYVHTGYEYRTIRFPNPVHVNIGQNFSIVLKMWVDGYGQNNGQVPGDFVVPTSSSSSFFSQDGIIWVSGQGGGVVPGYGDPVDLGVIVFTHRDTFIAQNTSTK
ncbi:MAG: lectin like domain-containing protein, partial [Candidatus Omnitrophica bacterium]|nr:lectin like domain-containing protein [Candidatus Omnitrophota bacterium]